ncbi:MAG: cytochrome C, partial [Anaerolineae bacterium]|nr:cytochrome C [Anaerolineae bacterium]
MLQIRHFLPDEQNTEEHTYLILRTGGGELERGLGYGIHWHIENPVEYIATDEFRQEIPWVRATFPDGRTVEYNDVTNPLSAEEIAAAETRVMDCVDCHNQMGHPFHSPERLADMALAEGQLSTDLPFAKKEMTALLSATYANQEEALAAVDSWAAQYQATY